MIARRWTSIGAVAALAAGALGAGALGTAAAAAEDEPTQLSVDLADETGLQVGVAQGILYGLTADGSEPADEYLEPLDINSYRGGGWFAGGWRADGYTLGENTQKEIDSIIAQAERLKAASSHPDDFHYEVIVSDLWGSTGGAPADSEWPCTGGDCANWEQFIDEAIGQLADSDIDFSYDIWNEPDLSIFWAPGVNTEQYFDMWDSGYEALRRTDPDALIVGPTYAFTPERRPEQWDEFFAHVKEAGTVPDWIANHNEGEGGTVNGVDDPVHVAELIRADLDEAGIAQRPLSSNEYQGAGIQTADTTAWYVNRMQQSTYSVGMRGNWSCCMIPNLTGLLSHAQTGWAPTGNWWALRTSADMTGELVQTSQLVDSLSISASKDEQAQRAVALLGDLHGATGSAEVSFGGFDDASYLVRDGSVHATVYRIPEGVAYAPVVQFSGELEIGDDGTIDVPVDFPEEHDAAAVYLSWDEPPTVAIDAPDELVPGNSYDVPVTVANGAAADIEGVETALSVTAEDPEKTEGIEIACVDPETGCGSADRVAPGAATTSTFRVTVPEDAPTMAYRLVAKAAYALDGDQRETSNSVDLVGACVAGSPCEAEDGALYGGTCFATDHADYSGSGFIACFDTTTPGRGVTQEFAVPEAGAYTLTLRYAAGPDGPSADDERTATVTAGGASQRVSLPPTGSWDAWGEASVEVELAAGTNEISVSMEEGDTGWFNLDRFELSAPEPDGPVIEASATTRCVAGKVVIAVTVRNADQGSATVSAATPYGTASFGTLAAGERVSKTVSTRKASIEGFDVETTATAQGRTEVASHVDATDCG